MRTMRVIRPGICRASEKFMISFERFLKLPPEQVASLVNAAGQKVCVFPVNGTRRWFMLEHADKIER